MRQRESIREDSRVASKSTGTRNKNLGLPIIFACGKIGISQMLATTFSNFLLENYKNAPLSGQCHERNYEAGKRNWLHLRFQRLKKRNFFLPTHLARNFTFRFP
jgi:hypothetical protein